MIILIILLLLLVVTLYLAIYEVCKFGIKHWYFFIFPSLLTMDVWIASNSIIDEEHYREKYVPNAIDLQEGRAEIKTTITDKTIIWNNRNNYDTVVLEDTVQTLRWKGRQFGKR